jgi:hypothetical protein
MRNFSSGQFARAMSRLRKGGGTTATTETLAHDFAPGGPGHPKASRPGIRGCSW